MKKITLFYIHLFMVLISYSQSEGDLIITEIMNDPEAVTDANGEYFEIYNTTSSDIDLNGLIIEDQNSNHTINQSVIIPANSYAVLGRNSDINTNGGVPVDYQYTSTITLNNSSGSIALKNGTTTIDLVDYTTFTIPKGKSLELATDKFNATDNDTASNWKASTITYGNGDYGTPGEANTNSSTLGIGISEIANFKLYPNPVTQGVFSISTGTNATKKVTVFTTMGKLILQHSVINNQPVYLNNVNSGVYILRVEENDKIVTRKLIVK